MMEEDDPLVRKMREAQERIKDERDVEEGEKRLAAEYQAVAIRDAPEEFNRMERLCQERCASLNAKATEGIPELQYNNTGHRVEARKYAIVLAPYLAQPMQLRVNIGWHPNANQFMSELPPINSVNMHFVATANDKGFAWQNVKNGDRKSSDEIVAESFDHLINLLISDI